MGALVPCGTRIRKGATQPPRTQPHSGPSLDPTRSQESSTRYLEVGTRRFAHQHRCVRAHGHRQRATPQPAEKCTLKAMETATSSRAGTCGTENPGKTKHNHVNPGGKQRHSPSLKAGSLRAQPPHTRGSEGAANQSRSFPVGSQALAFLAHAHSRCPSRTRAGSADALRNIERRSAHHPASQRTRMR